MSIHHSSLRQDDLPSVIIAAPKLVADFGDEMPFVGRYRGHLARKMCFMV
jgi:hypothetical protein